eukprot:TRINITY_DN89445_c0_g1_i1.p1 TRINITY_DN89445_c0_g1~~TRINITY_DN89445_c0_g1_i1.p1  ORF type:complete len:383 (+),score=55.87 TRINITY_DN89445_c0_g1_i1:77-1150(+)
MSDDYRLRTRNRILQGTNNLVGQARPSCYDLPPTAHAYGRSVSKDPEGAREVIASWMPHVPSERPEDKQQDFRKINKTATRNGITNAKQLGEFKQRVDIRVCPHVSDGGLPKASVPSLYDSKFAYGVKAKPSTPIEKLVGGSFAAESQERLKARYQEYSENADMPNGKHRIKLTKAAANRIADAKMRKHDPEDMASPRNHQFKIGKFTKVSPRLQLRPIAKEDMQPAVPVQPIDSIAKEQMQPAPMVPALPVPPPMDSSQHRFAQSARGPSRERREVDEIIRQHDQEMMFEMSQKFNMDSSDIAGQSNRGISEVSRRSNRKVSDIFRSSGVIREASDLRLSRIDEMRSEPLEISSAR